MQTLGTATSDADGAFKIDQPVLAAGTAPRYLSRRALQPDYCRPARPPPGCSFERLRRDQPSQADESWLQHMIMIEPTERAASQRTFFKSATPQYHAPRSAKGSVQFYLPDAAQKATVTIEAPGGMPIQRPAEKTTQADVFQSQLSGQARRDHL